MNSIRLTKQFDGYSWTFLLQGIKKRDGKHLINTGWLWVSGLHCPGAFYTKNNNLALRVSINLGISIEDITQQLKSMEYKGA